MGRDASSDDMKTFVRQHFFSLAIICVSALAYCVPGPFVRIGAFRCARLIVPLIQVIMFGMGTTLRLSDFTAIAKRPWPVLLGAVLQFSVMPVVGLFLAFAFRLEGDVAAGVVLIGSAAGGVASNVMAYIAGANVALSVTMTTVSTLLAPFLTPLLMRLLAGRFIEIDVAEMALSLFYMIVVPLLASQVVRLAFDSWLKGANRAIDRMLPFVSMGAICMIMMFCVAAAKEDLKRAGAVVVCVAILHNGIGYLLGYWGARLLGRFLALDARDCRTVAIEVGMQNAGMSQALAMDVLKSAGAAIAPTIFGVWMDFSGSILANWWRRRNLDGKEEEER